MSRDKNLVIVYAKSTPSEKVDLIMKRYPVFLNQVESYTAGLLYMIEAEKDSTWQKEKGELGVRVQAGGGPGDPTATLAIRHVMTKEALINCDFSGDVLDGVASGEVFKSDAYTLRKMRQDYMLFKDQLVILGADKELFERYLCGEMSLAELAEEQHITYESAQQKMHRMRAKVKMQVVGFMDRKTGGVS